VQYLTILNQSTASARMIWKMSKQKAFPFSTYFSHISHHTSIPVRALMAFIVLCMLVGLLVLGSHLAFYAILSGGGIAIQISFIVPILCVVLRGRSKVLPAGGPRFDLGPRWGYVINAVSLLWSVVVVLFYVFPQYMPVVGAIANMNWAIAIIGAVVLFAGVTWVAKASKHFQVEAPPILEGQSVQPGHVDASVRPVKT
jgi:choline transport protein